jgi:hypothetical protein
MNRKRASCWTVGVVMATYLVCRLTSTDTLHSVTSASLLSEWISLRIFSCVICTCSISALNQGAGPRLQYGLESLDLSELEFRSLFYALIWAYLAPWYIFKKFFECWLESWDIFHVESDTARCRPKSGSLRIFTQDTSTLYTCGIVFKI